MHEVQTLERMVLLNASEHVHATVFARMPLDHCVLVHDPEFVLVGGDAEAVTGNYADDGEEGALRFPALGAATDMVVKNVRVEFDFDAFGPGAFAVEFASSVVRVAW